MKQNIELYSTGKFLSVTGYHVEGTSLTLNEAQRPLDALYEKYFPLQTVSSDESILPKTQIVLSDKDIIQLLGTGPYAERFKKLFYNGDLSKYNNDSSAADWALCGMLLLHTRA